MRVTFRAGAMQQLVSIPIATDDEGEDLETFTAVLSSPSAGVTIGVGTATVEITDTTPVLVEFDPDAVSGREDGNTIIFTIVKRTTTTQTVSVVFSTSSVSAEGAFSCV